MNGDDITEMFFLNGGECGLVLPRFKNVSYIKLNPTNHFGLIDIVGSSKKHSFKVDDWYENRRLLAR